MTKYPLVPVNKLRSVKDALYARVLQEAPRIWLHVPSLDQTEVGEALAWSLLFQYWPDMLPGPPVSPEVSFYNRYFWFARYTVLKQQRDGPDGGLEQQLFKLLDYPDFDIDWEIIEQLQNDAGIPEI